MTNELRVRLDEANDATLDDLIHDIGIIWANKDAQRTIYDTLLHTVHHTSKLGEQVRRGEYQGVLNELGDTVMWFLTFMGKLQQSIEMREEASREERLFHTPLPLTDIVWNKYPNTCHVCFMRLLQDGKTDQAWKRECDCLLIPRIVEERPDEDKYATAIALLEFAKEREEEKVSKLGDLESMFSKIYRPNYENFSLESIAFHLLEEIGEMSDALIRLYTYDLNKTPNPADTLLKRRLNLEGEIADVVSWIFAVSLKVKLLYATYDKLPTEIGLAPLQPPPSSRAEQVNFVNILWSRYGDRNTHFLFCPSCRNQECNCNLTFYKTKVMIDRLLVT